MSEEWCTIESDPGVFTQLCEDIGVKGVQFEEIYSLDTDAFAQFDPSKIYGLVFLFKWKSDGQERPTVDAMDHGLFFANQVIQNACATQAILSVLLNVDSPSVNVGSHLKEFKEFTGSLDSQMKGLALSNSEVIRKSHNSFRQQSSFEMVHDKDQKGDDAFHFVGYICHQHKVYELDGLKKGPIFIGEVPAGISWTEVAREEIKRRVDTYMTKAADGAAGDESAVELRFNLMAIVGNKLHETEEKIMRERFLRSRANISLISRGEDVPELTDEVEDDDAPADIPSFEEISEKEVADVKAMVAKCTATIDELQITVDEQKKIRAKWEKENARRRHDMVPLVLCAMRHLAKKKQLLPAFEKGKVEFYKRQEAKKEAAAAAA